MELIRLLDSYDQQLALYELEAIVLSNSVALYIRHLSHHSQSRPLYFDEGQQLPTGLLLLQRLQQFTHGRWGRTAAGRPRARKLRLRFNELLLLNRLLRQEKLVSMDFASLGGVHLKINHLALNLNQFFEL